jgi:hypothetical protein
MIGKSVRGLVLATTVGVVVAFTGSAPANARGGVSSGAAVGIGLGSFALGTAIGSAANPYYSRTTPPTAMPTLPQATIPPHPIIRGAAGIRITGVITLARLRYG